MRTRYTKDAAGRVTIAYDDEAHWTGETVRIERTFTCPEDGGYVREKMSNGNWEQVCDKLAGMGNTLSCSSRDKLIDLIRAEYRAMRRAEKRAQA
jgi:hypothetical protein